MKFVLILFMMPFLCGLSLVSYKDYKTLSPEERYEDLKLRLSLNDYSNFGEGSGVSNPLKEEIKVLLDIGGEKKKVLELFLVKLMIDEGELDEALRELERFANESSPFIKSKYYCIKGRLAHTKNDFAKAVELYKKGLSYAEGIDRFLLLYFISGAEKGRGNNDKAIEYGQEALKEVSGYKPGMARLYLDLGTVYSRKGDMAVALDNYFKALDTFKVIKDDQNIVNTLNNIAVTKSRLGKFDDTVLYLKKAEEYFSDQVAPWLKAQVLTNIYATYSGAEDYESSKIYYDKAVNVAEKNNLTSDVIYLKSSYASENIERDMPKNGLVILDSLKSIEKEHWDNYDKFKYQQCYFKAYKKLNKYIEAEKYFSKGEALLDQVGREDVEASHYEQGIDLYKKMGKIEKEYMYYRKWKELNEKIEKEKSKKLLYARENESLTLNNKLYAQENKNLALKNEQAELILENQKTRLFMLSGFVFAILIIVALQFNRNKIINRKNRALKEKEKVIREKTNDLQAILDNIIQGVVTIELKNDGTRLLKDVSKHFYHIFTNLSSEAFTNEDPIKVLFQETSLSSEDLAKINSVIVSATGEALWQWEMNQGNLPMEMTILNGSKIIEIDWVVVPDLDIISKLIITFKDVTEIRGLGEKQRQNEINVQKLISLSLMDQKEYFILMSSVDKLIQEGIDTIRENRRFLKESIDLVFRNLHTIKGLARTYDLMLLSAFAHQIEDYFQDVRSVKIDYDQSKSLLKLEEMKNEIETYSTLAKTKLKWDQELSTVPLSVKVLTKWYQEISDVNEGHKLDVLLKEIKNKYSTSLKDALQNIIMSSQKLAKELQKGDIRFSLIGCDIFVTEKMEGHLSSIFVHLIRNSIDHGFLVSAEREMKNLPPPEINITVESGEENHLIYLSDNGQGLNLKSLQEKAAKININFNSDDEIAVANLIFESGLSTKEEVSNISGRGVGMDAVRNYLQDLGGSICLIANGESLDGYLPVAFKITVPLFFFET